MHLALTEAGRRRVCGLPGPQDRRAANVIVTAAGQAAISAARAAGQETLGELMTEWSPDDRAALLRRLGRLSAHLEPIVRGGDGL